MANHHLMKNKKDAHRCSRWLVLAGFVALFNMAEAQTWSQKANFGGGTRQYSAYTAVNGKGYIGFGNNNQVNDWWEYDPGTNTWTQKAPVPNGGGRAEVWAWSIGGKAYIGGGLLTGVGTSSEVWCYDPANNSWTQMASYPGSWTRGPSYFSIGTKGYIVSGSVYNEMWEYETTNNTWTRKNDVPVPAQRYYGVGFAVGGKGYMGTGVVGSTPQNDFWEWDPATDTWTRKANVPGINRVNAVSFASPTRGYIVTGHNNGGLAPTGIYTGDVLEYDPGTNTWTQKPSYPGGGKFAGAGWAINCDLFIAVGTDGYFNMHNDMWGLTVCSVVPLVASVAAADDSCYAGNKGKATGSATGGTPPYTYQWQPGGQTGASVNGLGAGNYKLIVTDNAQNKDTVDFIISQPQPLAILASADTAVCAGSSVLLKVTGGVSYSWSPSNELSSAAGDSVVANPSVSTSFIVTGTSSNGCTGNDTVTVTINTLQPLPELAATDTIFCSGDSTEVCVTGSYASYLWNTGSTGSCTVAKNAGGYWLTVTDANGCSAISGRKEIAVYPIPSISIVVQGDTLSSFNAVSYQWYFNEVLIDGATSPVYVAQESGDYSLRVVDINGCSSTSNKVTVLIDGIPEATDHLFRIYPNPCTSYLFVEGPTIESAALKDVLGRLVYQVASMPPVNKWVVDMKELHSGIYFITMQQGERQFQQKIIKQ